MVIIRKKQFVFLFVMLLPLLAYGDEDVTCILPDYFATTDMGGIPEGYVVNQGELVRTSSDGPFSFGSRMFDFEAGGDFTKGLYFREGNVVYGTLSGYTLSLEAGKVYYVHFNSACYKENGRWMKFEILDGNNAVAYTQMIYNNPNVNGSFKSVTESTDTDISFTPTTSGNYKLKWIATNSDGTDEVGFYEVLLANVQMYLLESGSMETFIVGNALKKAKAVREHNSAVRYNGSVYTTLDNTITQYDGATITTTSECRQAVDDLEAAIKAMNNHRDLCDTYDLLPVRALEIVNNYVDTKFIKSPYYQDLVLLVNKYGTRRNAVVTDPDTGESYEKEIFEVNPLKDDALLTTAIDELINAIAMAVGHENVEGSGNGMFTEGPSKIGSYNHSGTGYAVLLERMRLGASTLEKLGVDENSALMVAYNDAFSDDDELAERMKKRIEKEIYKQLRKADNTLFTDDNIEDDIIPAYDLTIFAKNPNIYKLKKSTTDFSQENIPGWTIVDCNSMMTGWDQLGNDRIPADAMLCSWNSGFTAYQTITDLPAGVYTLKAGFGERVDAESAVGSYFYVVNSANQTFKADCPVLALYSFPYASENGSVAINGIVVTDGKLTIGVHAGDNSHVFFNDIQLLMTGPAEGFDYQNAYGELPIENITFADAKVKAICVTNWDADSDGELSYKEAAAVTDLGELFKENKDITSFDELQYFTGLTSIGDYAFQYCSSLTSVTIPSSVTSIGEYGFEECERLTSITLNSVSSIGEAAFVCCTALTSVTIPSSVTSIGRFAFEGCVNLSSIVVHEDNPIYDSRDNCNAIIETTSNTLIVGCKTTIIPNTLTIIGENAFTYCEGLTSITIPNSVTDIGYGAFYECINLSSIVIGNSVTNIGEDAFNGCKGLTSIIIPSSVTSIGNGAFQGCINLSSIVVDEDNPVYDSRNNCNAIIRLRDNRLVVGCKTTIIPNSVSIIGSGAFEGCSALTSITIPNSVTSIGGYAFYGCSGLTSITIPNSITSIGGHAFYGCSGLTSVTVDIVTPLAVNADCFSNYKNATLNVPYGSGDAYHDANNWKEFNNIAELAPSPAIVFADNHVKALCVANWDTNSDGELSESEAASATDIGILFKGNNEITSFNELKYFTCLKKIEKDAFRECSSLTSITIPNSVTSIGSSAFSGCNGLTSITIPNSVTSIGGDVFGGCSSLISIVVAQYNSRFDSRNNCNAIIYTATNTLEIGCKTTTIPNTITTIGEEAFSGCSGLTSITIPNSITSIGVGAFAYCSDLSSITIPNSVTSIGGSAFEGCSALTSIAIPNSVTTIGTFAFANCDGLTSVLVRWNLPLAVTNYTFYYINLSNLTLYVPVGTLAAYEEADVWKDFGTKKEMSAPFSGTVSDSQGVKYTANDDESTCYVSGYESFYSATITIPEVYEGRRVTSIGERAFSGCSDLTSITIPNSVTNIEDDAFWQCSSIQSLYIPNSVTYIGDRVFSFCPNLITIEVDTENTKYDSRDNCNAIIETETNSLIVGGKNSIIPNSVTSIGINAFSGRDISSFIIPSNVTSIGSLAFYNCSGLTSVTVEWETPLEINNSVFSSVDLSNLTLIVPKGTKAAYEAADVWRDFGTIVEMGSGDLSGDGTVNGTDLVVQTNLILSGEYNPVADLNNDAKVNGTDYVMMVNVILDIASARAMTATTANRDAKLSIEDFSIRAGETKEMLVSLRNPDTDLTLLQFDLRLPAGLSIAKEGDDEGVDIAGRTTWKKHSLRSNAVGEVTRILLASNANAVFSGDEGRVVSIRLTADDGFSGGDIWLENQLLVAPDAWEIAPARYVYTVGGTTSISGVKTAKSADVYTLTGSKVRRQATSLDGLPKGVYVVKGRKVVVR